MLHLPGYVITERIDRSHNIDIYRGYAEDEDKRPCLIKHIHLTNPSVSSLAKVKQTYKVLQKLSLPHVLAIYKIQEQPDGIVLIFEEVSPLTLKSLLEKNTIPLNLFFQIGITLATTLQELHNHNITHGSIKPSNILIHPGSHQPKLWDFGFSSLITPSINYYDPHVLSTTLPYISPEQSGRTQRTADYRTDLYALGITFYEMLAGHPPFVSTDPLEIIHSHMARNPKPLSSILPDLPPIVSDIVLKLLAKEPENRYQSGRGLRLDLETCQQQFLKNGQVNPFAIGQYDQVAKFLIPQKLYGREKELIVLKKAVESIKQGGTEIIFVPGEAGVGKSSLIRELNAPIMQLGYFVTGKYEQLKRNKAYNGILQAVQDFVRQILRQSPENIAAWKERLSLALGSYTPILIGLVPEIGLLLEEPPSDSTSLPSINPNQLNLLFEQLMSAIATKEHPLIIFLDDLQWADFASFDLIKHMMSSSTISHTLFIVTYREDEVHAHHPLQTTIETIKETNLSINTIQLRSLAIEPVNQWIADTLGLKPNETTALADMIHQKAGGNPFFIKLFLQTLYEEDVLIFDDEAGWQWDLQSGRLLEATANVVNLMIQRINQLPASTQLVLSTAACIGNKFSLDVLSAVVNNSEEDTYLDLDPAITAGMVLPTNENTFHFAHDRIQQAVYSLLKVEKKQMCHWQIGHYWLNHYQIGSRDDEIFDIVNQLNLGQACIQAQADYFELLILNLEAGRKAKMSAAYQTAYDYLETALSFAQFYPNGWAMYYDKWLDLYNEAIECAYLSGHLEEMKQLIPILLEQVRTVPDKQVVSKIQIQAHLSKNQLSEAIAIGREILTELGILLPETPTQADFDASYHHIQTLLNGREIETLIELPLMRDANGLMAMHILSAISTAVWAVSPILYALDVFKRVELSLTLGNAPTSAAAYAGFGVILCSQIGDIVAGYRYGQLALETVNKYQVISQKARTYATAYSFTFHWRKPLRDSLPIFLEGHQNGIDVGDFSFSSSNAYLYVRHAYFSGQNLGLLNHRTTAFIHTVHQLKQDRAAYLLAMYQQVCLNLQTSSNNPYHLVGEVFNEDEILPIYQASHDKNRISILLCNKLILAYLFNAYDKAMQLAQQVKKNVDGLSASIYLPVFNFYDSLTHLAVYAQSATSEQKRILDRVANNQERLHYWAENAPMNFLHKWTLVAAETAVVTQKYGQAREYYDEAIALAKQHGYLQEEALANELAAKFYLSREQGGLAGYYANEAMDKYGRWGATAKLAQLNQTYPNIFKSETTNAIGIHSQTDESVLDYVTILKATRILSEEIELEKVLEKLMRVVIENAGAQTGYLILPNEEQLKIEAAVTIESDKVDIFIAKPVDASMAVSAPIIQHVAHTKETVLLHHAAQEGAFTNDPNIVAKQTKSILCMAIQRQQEVVGILYLENNLTTYAFTEARIDLLQILLGQAAISLQNATYYENLKQEIEDRKIAEKRLRSSEAEWRSLVNNAPDIILIVGKDMRVRFVNRLLPPLREEDVIGQFAYNFVLPQDQDLVKENIEFVFAHGEHTAYETSGPGVDGEIGWYSTRLGPILHEDEIVGVTMIATDITKRRQTEEQLRLYMAELERSNRELQEFAYVSSHDLQEPLRKIQAFGDRLEVKYEDVLDDRGLDYLKRMQNAAARMQTLIEDLLAFSRVSTKTSPFDQINLNDVLQDVLLNLELQIAQKNGRIQIAQLHQIEADGSQMVQLFQNLMSNALKFHRQDVPPMIHIKGKIVIDPQRNVPFVHITVEDNGIGFEEQYAERIFGVFQRLHGREHYEGTGVGLAICRKITDRHHGQISAISELGKGTKIIVILPQSQADMVDAYTPHHDYSGL